MSLRLSLPKLVGSYSWRYPVPRWTRVAVGGSFLAALFAAGCDGCGGGSLTCDPQGLHCQICDGYGCRPATDPPETGGAGSGGSAGGSGAGGAAWCDPTTVACPCDAKTPCADGKQCLQGLCVDGCDFSYQCGPGKVCYDGLCAPGCNSQQPCEPGYACTHDACVVDPTSPACDTSKPCPGGESCVGGLCTTGCTTNDQCAVGELCDGSSHGCIPDPSPTPACDSQALCLAGQVCAADGYCHFPCSTALDCKLIDNRYVACDQGFCKTDVEVHPECTLDKPCPAGQRCISNQCL